MITLEKIRNMKGMVRWFDPGVLVTVLKPVIISGIFGQYADRRLIHAALDRTSEEEAYTNADICSSFAKDQYGAIWFDYAADTGDGFDSTYAVAYSLAQPKLEVDGIETKRGELIVFGGDQVYPDASYKSYKSRFLDPFSWAYPDRKNSPDEQHPLAYLVPGNHDWYDGLQLFLALFCRRTTGKIGNWRVPQRRSYFALRLSETWWLWGVDFALSENVDQPQADYFESIAKTMPDNAKVIVCTATPGWLYGRTQTGKNDELHPTFKNLDYCFVMMKHAGKKFPIPLVLSGDTHHYSRYIGERSGTQFVTAGGGGAFLHPTHHLRKTSKAWWSRANDVISLASLNKENPASQNVKNTETELPVPACYPSQEISKKLLRGNFLFAFKNWKFAAILGGVYAFLGLLLVLWNDLASISETLTNPVFFLTVVMQIVTYIAYADDANWVRGGEVIFAQSSPKARKWILGIAHGLFHTAAIVLIAKATHWLVVTKFGFSFWIWGLNLSFVLTMGVVGGIVAGTIFGTYLFLTSRFLGAHANDAFSSMSMGTFKNFVRIKIQDDKLTLYPIGMDSVPSKNCWKPNPNDPTPTTPSLVIPQEALKHHLIEEPIEIS